MEEPLPAGGSCLLGSLNLAAFVKNPYTSKATFDKDEFEDAIIIAVNALNDVLIEGLPLHPLKEQRMSVRNWKQIGLGIMGLADMFIALGVEYGSQESLDILDEVGRTLTRAAIVSSAASLEEDVYPNFTRAVYETDFIKAHFDKDELDVLKLLPLRNSQILTCAPTGSIATMLGISNGIEPLFATSWTRKTESLHGEDVYYTQHPKVIEELMAANNLKDNELPEYIVTAYDIDPSKRIDIQATLQKHIDASISSTINLPNEATVEDIEKIYLEAWKKGLKGVTIYRDGCARSGILTTGETSTEKKEKKKCSCDCSAPKRGEVVTIQDERAIGFKRKLTTGCGSLHCATYFDVETGDLVETYLSKGSQGGCNNFMIGLSRLISMSARAGVSVEDIVDQLMSTGACPSYTRRTALHKDTSKGSCCPMAVGYAIKEMWEEFQGKGRTAQEEKPVTEQKIVTEKTPELTKCPECGETAFVAEGGCGICKECGFSPCG